MSEWLLAQGVADQFENEALEAIKSGNMSRADILLEVAKSWRMYSERLYNHQLSVAS